MEDSLRNMEAFMEDKWKNIQDMWRIDEEIRKICGKYREKLHKNNF